MKSFHLIVLFVTLYFVKKTSPASIWKILLSPDNPPLLRVRNFSEAGILKEFAVLDFVGLAERNSYPAEEHKIMTEDGYHLLLHRIPRGRLGNSKHERKVVYLQHGLFGSSDLWLMGNPKTNLAFSLADVGHDVWIGNTRGNTYCRSHKSLTPKDPRFWQFSYHEYSIYDLSAVVDYILQYTKRKKLTYIGLSMGATMSYILLSTKPEYNEKFSLVVNFAPVAFWNHGVKPPLDILAASHNIFKNFFESNEVYDFGSQNIMNEIIGKTLCTTSSPLQELCVSPVPFFAGDTPGQVNLTEIQEMFSHFPAGASIYTVLHYLQNIFTGKFSLYDYGPAINYAKYKQATPPSYNLKRITAPFYVYYGKNDHLVNFENVKEVCNRLQNVTLQIVPYDNFTHADFIVAKDRKTFVYDDVIEVLKHY